MTEAFQCDNCGMLFSGKPDLELIANLDGKTETKFETDLESGEYCAACAPKIIQGIKWSKED